MSIQIESDLKEILERFEKRFDKIDEKFEKIDKKFEKINEDNKELKETIVENNKQLKEAITNVEKQMIELSTKFDSELPTIKENIKDMRSGQQAQIWTLIGILFTAVAGFLVAVGKFVLSANNI